MSYVNKCGSLLGMETHCALEVKLLRKPCLSLFESSLLLLDHPFLKRN